MSNQRFVLTFDGIDDRLELSQSLPEITDTVTIEFWAKGGNNLADPTSIITASNPENTRFLNIQTKKSNSKSTISGLIGLLSKMLPQEQCLFIVMEKSGIKVMERRYY
jgi:hypothetical protein